jgi:GDP-L-fucose synthase
MKESYKYKRILVTGGSGVAGDGLKRVVDRGEYPGREFIFPTSKELNLLDLGATQRFISDWRPDAIIHLAAVSGGIQLTIDHPASVMRDNVLMNFNIIEAARLAGVKKILMTLSAAVYPPKAPIPLREEYMHEGYPHETNYSYAFAKRLIDPMIKAYRYEYKMNIVGMIPDAILGPRSNFNPQASTAIPALIRRFYENREGDSPLIVWGDGSPLRQVTFSEDIGRICMWFIENYDDPQPLNVGTMEEISIKDAAYTIADCLEIDRSRITFDTTKPAGTYRKATDNSRFVKLSGFKYQPIRETIRKTVEYFVANYPNPEKLRL